MYQYFYYNKSFFNFNFNLLLGPTRLENKVYEAYVTLMLLYVKCV